MKMSVTLSDNKIKFISIDINIKENKTTMKNHTIELDSDKLDKVKETHKIIIPAKIDVDKGTAILTVPTFWNIETIENYIQTLMDSLLLYKDQPEAVDKMIEEYSLEMLVFE